ncbi:hypothetical protein BSIN_2346 [Burkholderia singularis]|uniref:Uncharacterized protein n=1 Tax=Burkholderia singularis TaxID=1503053 RepID=A0A238H1J7_9BURK|nr:hypothetical protein BSIN_2346 [Burkholderia singularis]
MAPVPVIGKTVSRSGRRPKPLPWVKAIKGSGRFTAPSPPSRFRRSNRLKSALRQRCRPEQTLEFLR